MNTAHARRGLPAHTRIIAGAFLCVCLASGCATYAHADTKSDLDAAQAKYEEVSAQFDAIAEEYSAMSAELSDTLDAVEALQGELDETQAAIDEATERLLSHQDELAEFAASSYRNGEIGIVDVLMSSDSFESFVNNLYYAGKISEHKAELIEEVRAAHADLEEHQAALEEQMASLEELRATQQSQLDAMQAKRDEVQTILDGLDDDVRALTEKYDAELAAAAAAEAAERAAREAQEAAEAAAKEAASGTAPTLVVKGHGSLDDVLSAAYSTPTPGANLCAAWVSNVFVNAGVTEARGDACDLYARDCFSSDRDELKPGMIIAVSSCDCGWAGRMYGHVGIYIGDGQVRENIGYVKTTDLEHWIDYYGTLVTVRWGWYGGYELE